MRIISGIAKGKKILNPINKKTRPLKDMVRGSIFNIISHSKLLNIKLENCIVLDLFSGVGSFGLEAISRGAKKVIFFENYKPSIELLIKNINNLSFNNNAEINKKNIYNENNLKKINYKFNIIFLDPPFKDQNIKYIFKNLRELNILNSKTLIILHRHKKTIDNFGDKFKIAREEIYGSSKIIFGFFIF
tara:strand:+ start:2950 stop:3516 length:567 start_codon:yes stop_codon:yes gene_type:complete